MTARHVGARLKRPDDPRLLTGRGRYLDDLTLPRMAHVSFVRSPHAHAAIAGIEYDAARGGPGVLAVLTGPEAARLCKPYRGVLLHYAGMKTGAMLPLATDRARTARATWASRWWRLPRRAAPSRRTRRPGDRALRSAARGAHPRPGAGAAAHPRGAAPTT